MFNLFKKEQPPDPPTERQLNYARKLGIDTAGMSKADVSYAISDAETRNPSLGKQREQAKVAKHAKQHGPELIQLEQHWQKLADVEKWIVAVYQSGKSMKIDVIRVNGASLTDKGVLELECEIAKIKMDRDLGQIVDLGRYVELAFNKIKWHEVIDAIEIEDVATFQAAMQRGQNAAGRL